ncbi:hypothetical protein [Xanthocytophaga flava]|uniref:hypothetical protein n=1 Tax=Xanthocytophaga flava TaxID=3048013 RepID=UPI0028D1FBE1|nr:hypothetical protein [Xanthocytophaga flavus]MDJ1468173.1 hypothetical protein [Xanthocytophaga flavus]
MKVKSIIFVHNFFEWKSFFSAVFVWYPIRLLTQSYWNHCALLVELGGQDWIVEALGKGVTMTPRSVWELRARRKTVFMNGEYYPLWLTDAIGKRYDYVSILWWKIIKIITGSWYGPKWEQAKKAVFCSELCAMVVDCPHPWDISPGELYTYLIDYKNLKPL